MNTLTQKEKNLLAELLIREYEIITATPPMSQHDKELATAINKELKSLTK